MSIKICEKKSIYGENCHILFMSLLFFRGKRGIKKAGCIPAMSIFMKREINRRLAVLADDLFVSLFL